MKPNICSVIVIEWCMYAVTDVEYHKTARRVRALLFYITRLVSQGKFLARVTCQDNHLSHCRYTHTCRGPRLIICHEILYINFAAPRTHAHGSGCGAETRRRRPIEKIADTDYLIKCSKINDSRERILERALALSCISVVNLFARFDTRPSLFARTALSGFSFLDEPQ